MKDIKKIIKNASDILSAYPIFLGIVALGLLPAPVSMKIGESIGNLFYFILRDRRRVALFNLDIAIKGGLKINAEPEEIVRSVFVNLGRSASELSMLFFGRKGILKNCTIVGHENFIKANEKGRGVLFFTGHCGNWELGSIFQGWQVFPLSVVVRPLDNPYINGIIQRVRERYNNKVIDKKGALKKILKGLRNKGAIGILIDQSASRHESIATEFFGQEVHTTRLVALIALKTNAAVLPAFISRQGKGRHTITIGEEIPLVRTGVIEKDIFINTQNYTTKVEEYIKEHPTEWLWIHRRWKLRYGRKY